MKSQLTNASKQQKANGNLRPLGIAAFYDRINCTRSCSTILQIIYEPIFLTTLTVFDLDVVATPLLDTSEKEANDLLGL